MISFFKRLFKRKTEPVVFEPVPPATGRLSCSKPNLQNIPIKTETGRTVRDAMAGHGSGPLPGKTNINVVQAPEKTHFVKTTPWSEIKFKSEDSPRRHQEREEERRRRRRDDEDSVLNSALPITSSWSGGYSHDSSSSSSSSSSYDSGSSFGGFDGGDSGGGGASSSWD